MSVPNLDVAVPRDDLDDLLDSNIGGDDVFRELDTNMDAPELPLPRSRPANTTIGAANLGIDSEIKIAKQRIPIAKLDESRLLSANGIPKLRRITKDRLKFKGKGHEFSDVARLLNLYQLWLDDLFPKAKFADGLALIEKAGHSKRMQMMRREWIDESKPRDRDEERRWEALKAHDAKIQSMGDANPEPRIRGSSVPTTEAIQSGVIISGALDTEPQEENLPVSDSDEMGGSTSQITGPKSGSAPTEPTAQKALDNSTVTDQSLFFSDDEAPKAPAAQEFDDLDALLAEDEQRQDESNKASLSNPTIAKHRVPDEFEDEMEAMAGFDDW